MRSIAAALALCVLLAACGDKAENDQRTASGQVLEGTISDSMLPLDTLRSQPPLAKSTGKPGSDAAPEATGTPDAEATKGAETPVAADDEEG